MTPTLLIWFKIAILIYVVYNLYTIIKTFKIRGYVIPKQKKEWGSLLSDILFFGLSIFLFFIIRNNYEKPMDAVMQFKGQSLPAITYIDPKTNTTVSLNQKGTVILNIWASWCPPCRKEMPDLEKVHIKYATKGVKVIGLTDESPDVTAQFVQQNNYHFTIGSFSSSNTLLNSIETRPVSILLVDGKVKDIVVGARGYAFFSDWAASH